MNTFIYKSTDSKYLITLSKDIEFNFNSIEVYDYNKITPLTSIAGGTSLVASVSYDDSTSINSTEVSEFLSKFKDKGIVDDIIKILKEDLVIPEPSDGGSVYLGENPLVETVSIDSDFNNMELFSDI